MRNKAIVSFVRMQVDHPRHPSIDEGMLCVFSRILDFLKKRLPNLFYLQSLDSSGEIQEPAVSAVHGREVCWEGGNVKSDVWCMRRRGSSWQTKTQVDIGRSFTWETGVGFKEDPWAEREADGGFIWGKPAVGDWQVVGRLHLDCQDGGRCVHHHLFDHHDIVHDNHKLADDLRCHNQHLAGLNHLLPQPGLLGQVIHASLQDQFQTEFPKYDGLSMVIVMPSQQRQGEERCHRWQRKLRHTECNKANGCASLIATIRNYQAPVNQSILNSWIYYSQWFYISGLTRFFWLEAILGIKKEGPKLKELVTYNHRYEAHVEENNAISDWILIGSPNTKKHHVYLFKYIYTCKERQIPKAEISYGCLTWRRRWWWDYTPSAHALPATAMPDKYCL